MASYNPAATPRKEAKNDNSERWNTIIEIEPLLTLPFLANPIFSDFAFASTLSFFPSLLLSNFPFC